MAMKMKKNYQSPKVVSVLFDSGYNICMGIGQSPAEGTLSNKRRTNVNDNNQDNDVEWGNLW